MNKKRLFIIISVIAIFVGVLGGSKAIAAEKNDVAAISVDLDGPVNGRRLIIKVDSEKNQAPRLRTTAPTRNTW